MRVCVLLTNYLPDRGRLIKSSPGSGHKVIIVHGCMSTKKKSSTTCAKYMSRVHRSNTHASQRTSLKRRYTSSTYFHQQSIPFFALSACRVSLYIKKIINQACCHHHELLFSSMCAQINFFFFFLFDVRQAN